jgi:hypothetical protein
MVETDLEAIHTEALETERIGRRLAGYALHKANRGSVGYSVQPKAPRFARLSLLALGKERSPEEYLAANSILKEHNLAVSDGGGPYANFRFYMNIDRFESPDPDQQQPATETPTVDQSIQ